MSRQLFPAVVLPSNMCHLALLYAQQMAKVATQNETLPALPAADTFSVVA